MKQIVFLISAFVVLLQLLSTATADSQTDWAKIKSEIMSKLETMQNSVEKLDETAKSAWKKAKVTEPVKWAAFITEYLKRLNDVKKEFSELIGQYSKTSSVTSAEIESKIDRVEARISRKMSELTDKIVDAASGTRQEIDVSVDETMAAMTILIETEPANVKNIVIAAAQN